MRRLKTMALVLFGHIEMGKRQVSTTWRGKSMEWSKCEKVLITINTLIHAKSMYIMYGIYLSYIPQTETNYWSRNTEGMASSHFKCNSGWGGWVLWLQGYIALAQDPHHFDHESSHVRTHYINTPPCLSHHSPSHLQYRVDRGWLCSLLIQLPAIFGVLVTPSSVSGHSFK